MLLLSVTEDGGFHWSRARQVGGAIPASEAVAVRVRFAGVNGWIFGPGIFASHDNGRTWVEAYSGRIAALEPVGDAVWAVSGCDLQAVGSCVPALLMSNPGSDAWPSASVQPALAPMVEGSPYSGELVLERAPRGLAFLAEPDQLLVSRDSGSSWQSIPPPCTPVTGVRSIDGIHAWLLCSAIIGVHAEAAKKVYVSSDAGRSWQTRADNQAYVMNLSMKAPIPVDGYALAFVEPASNLGLYGAEFGAGIGRSADGGRTWRDIDIHDECIAAGNGISQLWFVTPLTGWAVAESSDGSACPALLRTDDAGVTWRILPSPLGP